MDLQEVAQNQVHRFWPSTATEWLDLTLKATLIVGGVLAAWQYHVVQHQNRIQRVMERLQEFNSPPMLTAQRKLNDTWSDYSNQLQALNRLSVSSAEEKRVIEEKVVVTIVTANALQRELDLLVHFFDHLYICVEAFLCDEPSSRAFFSAFARSLFSLHRTWIEVRRRIAPNYACRLQLFAFPEKEKYQCAPSINFPMP